MIQDRLKKNLESENSDSKNYIQSRVADFIMDVVVRSENRQELLRRALNDALYEHFDLDLNSITDKALESEDWDKWEGDITESLIEYFYNDFAHDKKDILYAEPAKEDIINHFTAYLVEEGFEDDIDDDAILKVVEEYLKK